MLTVYGPMKYSLIFLTFTKKTSDQKYL